VLFSLYVYLSVSIYYTMYIMIYYCISDSREESAAAAAAHSGRSVISIGESLKISVLNDSATSVRHVRGL
jgi:hypothetical protein